MSDDQFTKLFKYIEEFRHETNERFDSLESEVASLRNIPDQVASRFYHIETEQVARNAQWNRLVEWARKVSEKTGVPLPDL